MQGKIDNIPAFAVEIIEDDYNKKKSEIETLKHTEFSKEKNNNEVYERLTEIGFKGIKKLYKQHSCEVLRNVLDELDFIVLKRSIPNKAGYLRSLLPEPGEKYEFSQAYQKHLKAEQKTRQRAVKAEKEAVQRAEEEKRREKIRLEKEKAVESKIAEYPDEWENLIDEVFEELKIKKPKPKIDFKEKQKAASKILKSLKKSEQKEIKKKAESTVKEILTGISESNLAYTTAVENTITKIVEERYPLDISVFKEFEEGLKKEAVVIAKKRLVKNSGFA